MGEVHKSEEEEFGQFADPKAWDNDGAGTLKRKPMDVAQYVTFEIIQVGSQYQPRVEYIGGDYLKYGDPVDTLEDAKRYACDCFKEVWRLKTQRENERPDARVDMDMS